MLRILEEIEGPENKQDAQNRAKIAKIVEDALLDFVKTIASENVSSLSHVHVPYHSSHNIHTQGFYDTDQCTAKVLIVGSTFFGVQSIIDDLDLLCVVPNYITKYIVKRE